MELITYYLVFCNFLYFKGNKSKIGENSLSEMDEIRKQRSQNKPITKLLNTRNVVPWLLLDPKFL